MKRLSLCAVAAAAVLAAGCADADRVEVASRIKSAIVNGERSDASDDDVVQVTSKPPSSEPTSCSGTLVAANVVITALHCVAEFQFGQFSCDASGSLSSKNPGDGTIGEVASPDRISIGTGVFPDGTPAAVGLKVFGSGSDQICRNDMAIVVLDRDLDLPISPIRLSAGVDLGEAVRAVGYGSTETSGSSGRFRRDNLQIIDRGADSGGSSTSAAAPRTFVVGQGPCSGDSGGPAFSEKTNALLGVYSITAGASCTSLGVRNVYTRVAALSDLVNTAFAFAGHAPLDEVGEGAAGAADDSASLGGSSAGGSSSTQATAGGSLGANGQGAQRPGGSGSRQDGTCAFRGVRTGRARPANLGVLLTLLGLAAARRARRR